MELAGAKLGEITLLATVLKSTSGGSNALRVTAREVRIEPGTRVHDFKRKHETEKCALLDLFVNKCLVLVITHAIHRLKWCSGTATSGLQSPTQGRTQRGGLEVQPPH